LAVIAMVTAGCAYGGTPVSTGALRAGDTTVSVAELTDDIDYLAGSAVAGQSLFGTDLSAAASGAPGGPDGGARMQAAVLVLNLYTFTALLEAGLAAEGVEPSPDNLGQADAQVAGLDQQAPGMPSGLRSTLVRLVGLQLASTALAGEQATEPTDEEIRQAYDEAVGDGSQFDDYACASHILVSFDGGSGPGGGEPSDDEVAAALASIEAAQERLEAGEDFADVATEVSDDPGSAQGGGDLGCNFPDTFVPEFEQALYALSPGEVSAPVRTEFGYHLIELRSLGAPTLDDVADQIADGLSAQRNDPQRLILSLLERGAQGTEVEVNPRFGVWDSTQLQVVSPTGPSPAPTSDPLAGLLGGP
jgi:parvulin-like peptidyl-prolyl isomerase